jgi:hypothetical protein
MAISQLQLTVRGYRRRPTELPPNLLYGSIEHVMINRMSNAVDESRMKMDVAQLHLFFNDTIGDPDYTPRVTQQNSSLSSPPPSDAWGGERDCRQCACSIWAQQSRVLPLEEAVMQLHIDDPVFCLTQSNYRSETENVYHNTREIVFAPQVDVELPCGELFGEWFASLLDSWHAVWIAEDLSSTPPIYDFSTQMLVKMVIPRLVLTMHMDASSSTQWRDELSSSVVINIVQLEYERHWTYPVATAIRQVICMEEISIWDLTRHAAMDAWCMPSESSQQLQGFCMLLLTALDMDMSKEVDNAAVYSRPYGTRPPYPWPLPAVVRSKTLRMRAKSLHAAITIQFTDHLLWYCSNLEHVIGPPNVLEPAPNNQIKPSSMDMVISDVRFVLPAGPSLSEVALALDMRQLEITGQLATMELAIALVDAALKVVQLDLNEDNGLGALRDASSTYVVAPFSADLNTEINDSNGIERRIVVGQLPPLMVDVTPRSGALLWLQKELMVEHPFLQSRIDPEFLVPAKWDIDLEITRMLVTVAGGEDITQPFVRLDLKQVVYSQTRTQLESARLITVRSIDATSPLCDDATILTISEADSGKACVDVLIKNSSEPTMDVRIHTVNSYITPRLLDACLRFHDFFLMPTSSSRLALVRLKAAAVTNACTVVNGQAWGKGSNCLLGSCPKPALFVTMGVSVAEVSVELESLAQLRLATIDYSKKIKRPVDAPTTVSKVVTIGSLNAWSLANPSVAPKRGPGADGLPCVLAVVAPQISAGTASPMAGYTGMQQIPALSLEIQDTHPHTCCPWMAQQASAVASVGRPILHYTLRTGSVFGSVQRDFLEQLIVFANALIPVFAEAREAADPIIPRGKHAQVGVVRGLPPVESWAQAPFIVDADFHNPLFHPPAGGHCWEEGAVQPILPLTRAVTSSLDLKIGTAQFAVTIDQQQKRHSASSRDLSRDHARERHALVVRLDNFYVKGMLESAFTVGADIRLLSGTLHAMSRIGPYVPHHELTMSSQQPLMREVISLDAKATFTDEASTQRILRCAVPMVQLAASESQYALVLAALDQLSALNELKDLREFAPDKPPKIISDSRMKPSAPMQSAIRIEGMTADLVYEHAGQELALLSLSAAPIFISHRTGDLQIRFITMHVTTQCPASLSSAHMPVLPFPLLRTQPITILPGTEYAERTDTASSNRHFLIDKDDVDDFTSAWPKVKTAEYARIQIKDGEGTTQQLQASQTVTVNEEPGQLSTAVSVLDEGTVIDVLEQVTDHENRVWVRHSTGWSSVTNADGVSVLLRVFDEGPTLIVALGDTDFIVIPEFAAVFQEWLVRTRRHYSLLLKSKEDIEAAIAAEVSKPRKSDIVLTEDDIITQDLALTANTRLFVKPRKGKTLTLSGNGFSVRFEDGNFESSEDEQDADQVPFDELKDPAAQPDAPLLIFVPAGVTFCLVDMVLENYNKAYVSLGDNASMDGIVKLTNIVELKTPSSRSTLRRLRRRSRDSNEAPRSSGGSDSGSGVRGPGSTSSGGGGESSGAGDKSGGGDSSGGGGRTSTIEDETPSAQDGPANMADFEGLDEDQAYRAPDMTVHFVTQMVRVHVMDSIIETTSSKLRFPPSDISSDRAKRHRGVASSRKAAETTSEDDDAMPLKSMSLHDLKSLSDDEDLALMSTCTYAILFLLPSCVID